MRPTTPVLFTLMGLLTACRVVPPQTASVGSDTAVQDPVVVVLVLDGARVDESFGDGVSSVTGAPTEDLLPRIRSELFPRGTRFSGALASGVPITTEGHAELLTGTRAPLATFPPATTRTYRSDLPTIFEALGVQQGVPAEGMAVLVNTVHLSDLLTSRDPDLGAGFAPFYDNLTPANGEEPSDPAVVAAVQSYLNSHDARLVVANLHKMDLAGHNDPGQAYPDRVADVDDPIADLWQFIENTERYAGRTSLILVADHGRHRWDEPADEPWRNHGDQCVGCREIPLLMLGPQIVAGQTLAHPATLQDVGATVAHLLQLDMPDVGGRVLAEALSDPPERAAYTGVGVVRSGGGVVVEERRVDAVDARTEIWVNGVQRSSPAALHAEAPSLAAHPDGGALVCWRELVLDAPARGTGEWAWAPRCLGVDAAGAVAAADPPLLLVSPFFAPALAADADGGVWMAWSGSAHGYAGAAGVSPALLRWTPEGGWADPIVAGHEGSHPLDPALALTPGGGAWVAQAESIDETLGRDTRSVVLWHVDGLAEAPVWSEVYRWTPDSLMGRFAKPAVHLSGGGTTTVAAIAYAEQGGNRLVRAAGQGAQAWSDLSPADETGRVLPHIAPRFGPDGSLFWAERDADGRVALCERTQEAAAPVCQSLAAAHVASLDVAEDGRPVLTLWQGAQGWLAQSVP